MLMNTPRFTLKPLVATMSRHRFVPLYLVAMGMGAGTVQAAEDDNSATPAAAVVAAPTTQLQRVEVTGSAIRRVDAETAVPITILKAEELRKQGVTTTGSFFSAGATASVFGRLTLIALVISGAVTMNTTSSTSITSTSGVTFISLSTSSLS